MMYLECFIHIGGRGKGLVIMRSYLYIYRMKHKGNVGIILE